ncbi:hypothetical protein SMACR_07964 [Sordaria macrospora]|uniref:WGS project CABT00000000 data, contig 2.48 n=2 Tax=Sordaria macrospora TaxID=5147 RepID=F7W913_SORMK|nr:uncharacterized protein SMAC_07964 [Sordaria macrospora k-hell]KAA8631955.1 hypothetical protein SMACR_07964 [Sordaria macrospora]WPJ61144.1 hypothetical protein SMAC4_07964 [Sordaria macrospora]CCC13894.1 unnamed protein product [Sordaria macrospora k-hell]
MGFLFFGRSKKPKKDNNSRDTPTPTPSHLSSRGHRDRQVSGSSSKHYYAALPPPPAYSPHDWQQGQQFEPAGLLPSPPGWSPSSPQPIIVNQHHYYLGTPGPGSPPPQLLQSIPPLPPPKNSTGSLTKMPVGTVMEVASDISQVPSLVHGYEESLSHWPDNKTQLLNQSAALYDQISGRLNDVLTRIDLNQISGNEKDHFTWKPAVQETSYPPSSSMVGSRSVVKSGLRRSSSHSREHRDREHREHSSSTNSGGYFAKVDLYANSRLPTDLPPLRLYIPTWPLLCLAAQYSERVYEKPKGAERDAHVDADWRTGAKAMVIKSVPMDYVNTIVFAIRGTATFMDWAVNLNSNPTSPEGFLDDPGNLCHAGFLDVARSMVQPVARRLRQLLEEDPSRSSYSLLITGHSAGGAVAALLYSHILSTTKEAQSELTAVAGCFKRVHCVTFGTPPISIIPLKKPEDYERRPELKKSLFLTFLNEGDPVARADKAYVKSLLELYASPAPSVNTLSRTTSRKGPSSSSDLNTRMKAAGQKSSRSSLQSSKSGKSTDTRNTEHRSSSGSSHHTSSSSGSSRRSSSRTRTSTSSASSALTTTSTTASSISSSPSNHTTSSSSSSSSGPTWKLPASTLSSAGRLVVLRSGDPKSRLKGKGKTVEERLNEGVVAHVVGSEDMLKEVVWGDPLMHVMKLYKGRIETLAVGAVTARGY